MLMRPSVGIISLDLLEYIRRKRSDESYDTWFIVYKQICRAFYVDLPEMT